MRCSSTTGYSDWKEQQVPMTFSEWKSLLSKLTKEEIAKRLSSTVDSRRLSASRQHSATTKTTESQSLARNNPFTDSAVDSFLVSSSSNLVQSTPKLSQQDVQRLAASPTKRYVSSFKTLVNSTSGKHTQRLSYANDSVIIVKLSKENTAVNSTGISHVPNKNSLAMATSTTAVTIPNRKQQLFSAARLSPLLKLEAQKRRAVYYDSSSIVSTNNTLNPVTNSVLNMAMSTTSHTPSNQSLFAYRNMITGGNTIRQRVFADSPANNLLPTTERVKSNISSAMRPTRQPLTTTTTMTSTYIPSQQPQRNTNQNTKSRSQQDKVTTAKDVYEYPDPFTNCPQDFLNKLAQLTKLQLETIEWEKKRRFTKKKSMTNGGTQGKDSP